MDVYLFIAALTIFVIFSIYENIRASLYVSKCFTKETKNEHNYITRVKVLVLPKSKWIDTVNGEYVSNLVKANKCWQNYFKRLFVSMGIFIIVILMIASPSIYYVLTH